MTDRPENPLIRAEIENVKFGVITTSLGLAAVIGSFGFPNHSKPLYNLERSLDVAGVIVACKGVAQALEAGNRWDELEAKERKK